MINKIKSEIFNHSNFLKVTFLSSISSGLKIIVSFIVSKLISIFIGPIGFAVSGQLNNVLSILHAIGSAGVNIGLTKYVSENENEPTQREKFVQAAFWLMFLFTTVSSILLILFSTKISTIVTKTPEFYFFILLLGLAMFFYNAGQIFLSILNGLKLFKSFIFINILISFFGLIISACLIYWLKLNGVILSIILNLFLYFIVLIPFIKRANWFSINRFLPKYHSQEVRRLLSFSLMFLFSSSVTPIVQIMLRSHIINNLSMTDAGFWEAINRISQIPILILSTAFSTYYLPKLSQIKTRELMNFEVKKTLRVIFVISATVLIVLYFTRQYLILLVFSKSFSPINDLLLFQLMGDFFRLLSFVFAYVLLAKAQTRYFVIAEVFGGVLFYMFSLLFINIYGLIGVTYAYFISYVLYCAIVMYFFRRIRF